MLRSVRNASAISLVVCAVAVVAKAQAEPQVSVEAVDSIDESNVAAWWSPIAADPADGSIYATYLRPHPTRDRDHDVYLARRNATGQWSTVDTGGDAWHDPGHTQASIAIDGDGYTHLFYGMHTGPLRYRRSVAPRRPNAGFEQLFPDALVDGDYTYPNLTTAPNGDVFLGIRDYPDGEFYRYDVESEQWSLIGVYAEQEGTTVYPDHFFADAEGNIHVIWEWAAGQAQAARHNGSYALYHPDSDMYTRADGTEYNKLPISMEDADIMQPVEGNETFERGVHGYQSAKLTVDDQNRPIVAYAYSMNQQADGYEFRLARWDGQQWQRQTVVPGPFSLDKPWVTFSNGQIRYYGTVSPSDPLHTGSDDIFLRTSDDYGQTWSEPVQITDGMSVQRPIGVTHDGVDYLYLPSMNDHMLYVACVVPADPASMTTYAE